MYSRQTQNGRLEFEVLDHAGHRPVRVVFDEDGHVQVTDGSTLIDGGSYTANSWHHIKINVNVTNGKYDLLMDNNMIVRQAIFAESVFSIEQALISHRRISHGTNSSNGPL